MYAFKFQHPRALRYIWLVILGPVAALALVVWLTGPSLPAVLGSILGSLGIGFYLLFTKGKASDVISLDNHGFTSGFFGRVEFADIREVSGRSFFMDPPSMRIELNDGRKLTWRITHRGSIYNSVEDAETFLRFTAALSVGMDAWRAGSPQPAAQRSIPVSEAILPTPDSAEQLRKVVKRNTKPAWAVPIGAAFAIVGFVKTCGKDWFKRDEINFGKIAAQQEKQYHSNIETAKAVMAKHIKSQGAFFLYTNDTAARAELLPEIDVTEPTGIAAFRHTGANRELEAFIAQPDSFNLQTIIAAGDGTVAPMRASILNMDDSAAAKLFIRFYDPRQRIEPGALRGQRTDSTEWPVFDVKTAIPLYDTLHFKDPISHALPAMHMMLAQVRHRPSFRVYLTGRVKEGVPETVFRKAVRELNRQMAAVEVDTGKFVIKIYNQ